MKFQILTLLWVFLITLMVNEPIQAQKIGVVAKMPPTMSSPRGEVLEWISDQSQPYWYRLPAKIDEKSPSRLAANPELFSDGE